MVAGPAPAGVIGERTGAVKAAAETGALENAAIVLLEIIAASWRTDPNNPLTAVPRMKLLPLAFAILSMMPMPVWAQVPGVPPSHSAPDHASDLVNVHDYGARCDSATDDAPAFIRAVAAAMARNNGARIYIPGGRCTLASSVAVSVPAGRSIAFMGDGADVTILRFAPGVDGLAITLLAFSGASVSSLTIERTGSHSAGNTALAITETQDRSGAVTVRDVVTQSDHYPGSWANGIVLTSTADAVVDHVYTVAGFPPENANGLVIKGLDGHYAVDTKIANSKLQGGNNGLLVSGYVQGVVATNLFAIAGNYGVTWTDGLANPRYVSELLEITNGHINAIRQDVRVAGVSITLSDSLLWRWPDTSGDATPWTCLDLDHAGASIIHHNNVNGGNGRIFSGHEVFVHLADTAAAKIDNNTILTINGPYVQIDGRSSVANSVTANIVNGAADMVDNSGGYNHVDGNSISGISDINTVAGNLTLRAPSDTSIATTGPLSSGQSGSAAARSNGSILGCKDVLASFNWNLPTKPFQGQVSHIASECSIAHLAITPQPANAGIKVVGAPASMSPSTPLTFIYDASNRIWTRW